MRTTNSLVHEEQRNFQFPFCDGGHHQACLQSPVMNHAIRPVPLWLSFNPNQMIVTAFLSPLEMRWRALFDSFSHSYPGNSFTISPSHFWVIKFKSRFIQPRREGFSWQIRAVISRFEVSGAYEGVHHCTPKRKTEDHDNADGKSSELKRTIWKYYKLS